MTSALSSSSSICTTPEVSLSARDLAIIQSLSATQSSRKVLQIISNYLKQTEQITDQPAVQLANNIEGRLTIIQKDSNCFICWFFVCFMNWCFLDEWKDNSEIATSLYEKFHKKIANCAVKVRQASEDALRHISTLCGNSAAPTPSVTPEQVTINLKKAKIKKSRHGTLIILNAPGGPIAVSPSSLHSFSNKKPQKGRGTLLILNPPGGRMAVSHAQVIRNGRHGTLILETTRGKIEVPLPSTPHDEESTDSTQERHRGTLVYPQDPITGEAIAGSPSSLQPIPPTPSPTIENPPQTPPVESTRACQASEKISQIKVPVKQEPTHEALYKQSVTGDAVTGSFSLLQSTPPTAPSTAENPPQPSLVERIRRASQTLTKAISRSIARIVEKEPINETLCKQSVAELSAHLPKQIVDIWRAGVTNPFLPMTSWKKLSGSSANRTTYQAVLDKETSYKVSYQSRLIHAIRIVFQKKITITIDKHSDSDISIQFEGIGASAHGANINLKKITIKLNKQKDCFSWTITRNKPAKELLVPKSMIHQHFIDLLQVVSLTKDQLPLPNSLPKELADFIDNQTTTLSEKHCSLFEEILKSRSIKD